MNEHPLTTLWQQHEEIVKIRLADAFIRHAIDNRGLLTSGRRTNEVVDKVNQLAWHFVTETSEDVDVVVGVTELADRGLAMVCGTAMMNALGTGNWLPTADPQLQQSLAQKLLQFQLLFLEKLAAALVLIQQRTQERSQKALQDALHAQIEQQRQLRYEQEAYNKAATRILSLNAQLAGVNDEGTLIEQAVNGLCRALDLVDATLYELNKPENHWSVRLTTSTNIKLYDVIPNDVLGHLNRALTHGESLNATTTVDDRQNLSVVLLLQSSQNILGALWANSHRLLEHQAANLPILLRTFSQSLAAHWHNLQLFAETKQRSLEMEILYGRYMDTIWNPETVALQATYQPNNFQLDREPGQMTEPTSEQALPLVINDYPIGHVILPDDLPLNQDQTEFVHSLVREMSNALNNAYLLQTTRATSNQLSLATEVSRAATTILDHALLIKEVVELIRARFNFYYVGLFLIDDQGKTAVLQAGTGEAGRLQVERQHYQVVGGPSMIGTCIISGEAIVEQDITQARAFKFNPLLPHTRSELAMPLRTRGQIIGALTVQSSQKGAFTGEAIAVLQSLADQLAIAIENAGLFAQTQATLAETSRLYQTSRQISEAPTSAEIHQALVAFARDSDQVDGACVVVNDEADPDKLKPTALWSRHRLNMVQFPKRTFVFNKQQADDKVVGIIHTHNDTRLDETTRQLFLRNNIRTLALIPLYTEETWLGTFVLHRTRTDPFDEQALRPYRTLADQAAVILANQQLFSEIKQANERLRQLDQLKTQFLANMSHELRTPLNSIIGFSRVILKGIDGPISSDQEEDLNAIHNNGQHLLSLINEILDMAKIEAGKLALTFEPVDLEATAEVAFDSIRSLVKEGVQLIWAVQSNLPPIEADQVRLRQILTNLLSNSAKFTHEGYIRLEIFAEDEEKVHIAVRDSGIGIASEEFEVLFRAFEQIDNSTTRQEGGTGLGLPITKWLVTMHEGHIWVESTKNQGSAFHVILPWQRTQDLTPPTFAESLLTE